MPTDLTAVLFLFLSGKGFNATYLSTTGISETKYCGTKFDPYNIDC